MHKRTRTRRVAVDQPRRLEHTGRQGHTGAALQDVNGVELADSWYDWINWKNLGYQGAGKDPANGNSFVPDRNAGIWKPVYLRVSGAVVLGPATVNTELPLPRTDSARLTIYTSLRNTSTQQVRGVLRATITRPGKPDIQVEQPVTLAAGEEPGDHVRPRTIRRACGRPIPTFGGPTRSANPISTTCSWNSASSTGRPTTSHLRFGIRTVSQHRDNDHQFPELGKGGSFYLTVNGRDFLVRGAAYTPDLLFADDPARDAATLRYVKDLGLNMIRLEGKFPGDRIVEMADEMGIPLMFGWMCCNQWEKWAQWDDEDNRVAQDSLRSQILTLRRHPSVFVWANGSDGMPPPAVLDRVPLNPGELHWQNATVDTVSSLARDTQRENACGTAFRWRARTVGDRRATGSADDMPPPAAPPPNRATTKTSRRWRA